MFAEDLSVIFNASEFATAATLNGVAVTGIFDNASAATLLGAMGGRGVSLSGMAGTHPTLTLPTASVPANPVGAAVVIASVNYLIAAHEPDGTGVSTLELELV